MTLNEIWFFVPKSFNKSLYIGSCSNTGSCIFWHVIAIDPLVSKWGCCRWFYTSWEQNPSWLYMRELSFTTTANLEHPLKLKDVWCDLCHSWIKWRMNGMVLASDCKWFCSFCLRLLGVESSVVASGTGLFIAKLMRNLAAAALNCKKFTEPPFSAFSRPNSGNSWLCTDEELFGQVSDLWEL